MGLVSNIINNFDQKHSLYRSDSHSVCCSANDRDVIVKEIKEKALVFKQIPGRSHLSFPNFVCNPLKKVKYEEIVEWMQQCAKNMNCHSAFL